jgi:hypothetical protein
MQKRKKYFKGRRRRSARLVHSIKQTTTNAADEFNQKKNKIFFFHLVVTRSSNEMTFQPIEIRFFIFVICTPITHQSVSSVTSSQSDTTPFFLGEGKPPGQSSDEEKKMK